MPQHIQVMMLSAPATIPVARQPTFTSAFTPHGPRQDIRLYQLSQAARWVRAITGTKPALDTRSGSSNDARVFASSCSNRTRQVLLRLRAMEALDAPIAPGQGAPIASKRCIPTLFARCTEA